MSRTTRAVSGGALVVACLGAAACSSSNEPPTTGSGGITAAGSSGTAGSGVSGSGGSTAGSGGTSTGGTATGGSSGTATTGGSGGSSAGTGGSTGGSGGSSGSFSPACGTTSAGIAIAKGIACTATDTQLCYKTCGPINVGYKSETCTSGLYVEGPCQFPTDADYSCFQIPTADATGCPTTAPQHNQPCSITECSLPCTGTACAICGLSTGYLDSTGNPKTGYCVCIAGSAGTKWSCASATAWPCPGGMGC